MSIRGNYPPEQSVVSGMKNLSEIGEGRSVSEDTILSLFSDVEMAISNIHSHKERLLRVSRSMGIVPTPIEKELHRDDVASEPAHFQQRVYNNRNFVRSLADEIGYLVERLEDNFQ